ncbi:MAG: hypothetical protein Q7K21_00750, partial [Elusimicrobiota bacterium]|nr:hypothetical protein [Elusimicrobiota bacterium]
NAPTGGTTLPDGSVDWINDPTPAFSWTFSDPDGDAQSAFQLITSGGYDTGKVVSGSSSHTPGTALADGDQTWQVRTWDLSDAVGPYNAWTVKIDATDPTTPASLDAGYNGTNASTLTWTASTDATSGLKTYNVYRATYPAFSVGGPNVTKLNGGDVTVTNYTDSTVLVDKTYYYGITAVDNAVNTSALSNIKSVITGATPATNLLPSTTGQWHFGFEAAGATFDVPVCWQEFESAAGAIDGVNTFVRTDARSCRFTDITTAYSERAVLSATCTVTAGNNYSVGIWCYVPTLAGAVTDVQFELGIKWYNASGAFLSENLSSGLTLSAYATWQKLTYINVTAPAGATGGRLLVGTKETNALNYDPCIDDAEFISVSPPSDTSAPTNVGLVSPANNAVNVSTTSTLTVNAAADATPLVSYYIQLALDTGFTSGVQFRDWNTSTSWTAPAPVLANNTTYYWRVKARDSVATPNETTYKGHTLDTDGYGKFVTISSTTINNPPLAPASLGGVSVVSGLWINDNTPPFEFILDDPDNNNVKYKIVIDDSADFLSPAVDYTSALAAEGLRTFTVGQAAGGGSYTTGSAGQTLADSAGYYWQVKCFDDAGAESSYSVANGGAIAFKLDTAVGTPTSLNAGYNGTNASTLTWTTGDVTPSGLKTYNVYRATYAFTATTQPNVTKLNAVDVTVTNYTDYPAAGQ